MKFGLRLLRLVLCMGLLLPLSAFAGNRHGVAPSSANAGGVLMNLAPVGYGGGYSPFLNWWAGNGSETTLISTVNGTLVGQQIADCPLTTNSPCSTPTTYLDSNGELVTPVPADVTSISRIFFTTVGFPQYQYEGTSFGNFASSTWNVTWTGCATPGATNGGPTYWFGLPGPGGAISSSANSSFLTFGTSAYSNVGLTFTMNTACLANPPKKIFVSQSQYSTNVTNGETWNPDWLSAVKPFYMLRFMDWMSTNNSGITDSSQLADLNYTSYAHTFAMARSQGSNSVSGTTLTIGGWDGLQLWKPGYTVFCYVTGCPSGGMVIDHQLTGTTGQNGTYALTASFGTIGSSIYIATPNVGGGSGYGTKGGIHPTMVCSLANAANTNVEYPIPAAASNQFVTDVATSFQSCLNPWLKVKFSYCNETWNSGNGFDCYRYANSKDLVNGGQYFVGYRAAQIMQIVAGVFGTNSYSYSSPNGSRWIGAIGGQAADKTQAQGAITGAAAYIATGIPYTLTQLFAEVDVAPYWGNFWNGSAPITGISISTTPTITASNSYTPGQIVRLFVNGGTMTALNNMDVTVASPTSTNFVATPFNGSNPDTTSLTYGGTGNEAIDSTIFRLGDQSTALNISTYAIYPTKFSYYNQQMSKAIYNGTASDSSYGTITIANALNLTTGSTGILAPMQANALVANVNGLVLSQYEAGPTQEAQFSLANGNAQVASGAVEFMNMSLFDNGVAGDTSCGGIACSSPNLFATMYSQFNSIGIYPAQFNDAQSQTNAGPWGVIRFFPGDTSNYKYQAVLAQNAKGVYVDPTPPATWSVNYNSATDHNFGSGGSTTLTCPLTAPSDGLAVVGINWTSSTAISSVTLDGSAMTNDSDYHSVWGASIWSKPVTASGSPHTITVMWGTSVSARSCYALTLSGLASNSAQSQVNGQKNLFLSETKGSFIFAVSALATASTFNSCSTAAGLPTGGTISTVDNYLAQASGFAYWSPGPTFTTTLFNVCTFSSNGTAVATYR